jgi:hypothetical protein
VDVGSRTVSARPVTLNPPGGITAAFAIHGETLIVRSDNRVYFLRPIDRKPDRAGVTYSGYFDFENCDAIAGAVTQLNGRAEGVYVVLNRFNPTLLARAKNRL